MDWTKLKAFADDNLNATQMDNFVLDRIENNVGKGENAVYQHFLLFPHCFQKVRSSGSLKLGILWYRVNKVKPENGSYQHFLLFIQCFQKASFQGSLNLGLFYKGLRIK